MWCHSLLSCIVSVEKSADNLMGVPLYVICHFPLVALDILSLPLIFVSLCLVVFLLGFSLPGTLCFLELVDYFLPHVSEVFSYYLYKYFLRSFLSFSFWDPYNVNVGVLNVVPEVSSFFFLIFILFSKFCSVAVISTTLSTRSFIHSFASVILLLVSF